MQEEMKRADAVMMLGGRRLALWTFYLAGLALFGESTLRHTDGANAEKILAWVTSQWWFHIEVFGAIILAGYVIKRLALKGFWSRELEGLKRICGRKPPLDRKQEVSRELLEKYIPRSQVKNPLP